MMEGRKKAGRPVLGEREKRLEKQEEWRGGSQYCAAGGVGSGEHVCEESISCYFCIVRIPYVYTELQSFPNAS